MSFDERVVAVNEREDEFQEMTNEEYHVNYKELTIEMLKDIHDERIVKSLFYITEKLVSREI